MSRSVTIAILAAGKGTRFGSGKLDAAIAGKPLGQYVLDAALDLDMGRPEIVVSKNVPSFAREAGRRGRAILVENAQAEEGLASSVAMAARSAQDRGSDLLLLVLADMPQVHASLLADLVEAAGPSRPSAVRHEDGRPGVPACFPAEFFKQLQQLEGDHGAAAILAGAADVALVDAPKDELFDVDTEQDLEALKAQHRL
jgi:CTP:molybdopterin cytidylyltransferase MocA